MFYFATHFLIFFVCIIVLGCKHKHEYCVLFIKFFAEVSNLFYFISCKFALFISKQYAHNDYAWEIVVSFSLFLLLSSFFSLCVFCFCYLIYNSNEHGYFSFELIYILFFMRKSSVSNVHWKMPHICRIIVVFVATIWDLQSSSWLCTNQIAVI